MKKIIKKLFIFIIYPNKNTLSIGGTGNFGRKYTEIILSKYSPNKIIIYSRDELKQSEIENSLMEYSKILDV